MAKIDKRAKRAKEKAKQARVRKQNEIQANNKKPNNQQVTRPSKTDKVQIATPALKLFKTLPSPTDRRFECFFKIKRHLNEQQFTDMEDPEMLLVMTYIMFQHWFETGDEFIEQVKLYNLADTLIEDLSYKYGINAGISVLEDELYKTRPDLGEPSIELSRNLFGRLMDWLDYMDGDPPIDNNDNFRYLRKNRPDWTFTMCAIYWKFDTELTGGRLSEQPSQDIESKIRDVTYIAYRAWYFLRER